MDRLFTGYGCLALALILLGGLELIPWWPLEALALMCAGSALLEIILRHERRL